MGVVGPAPVGAAGVGAGVVGKGHTPTSVGVGATEVVVGRPSNDTSRSKPGATTPIVGIASGPAVELFSLASAVAPGLDGPASYTSAEDAGMVCSAATAAAVPRAAALPPIIEAAREGRLGALRLFM
jgi:hypothetical protein